MTAYTAHQVRASIRQKDMEATRGFKVMRRIRRRLRQIEINERRHILEGYSLNVPRVDDLLLHINTPIGRQSVRFLPSGDMRWFTGVVFAHELMQAAE